MACTEWVNRRVCRMIVDHLIMRPFAERALFTKEKAMKPKPKPRPPRKPRPGY